MVKKCLAGDAASEAMDGVTPELRQEASLREKRHPRDTPCPISSPHQQHATSIQQPHTKKLTQTTNESPQATAKSDSLVHLAHARQSKFFAQD